MHKFWLDVYAKRIRTRNHQLFSSFSLLIFEFISVLKVKKLERENRLNAIVDENLNDYDIREVEMITQVALLCTQQSSVDRPTMSQVIRMLEGEGLAERWEEWQHLEVTRKQDYERMQRRFALGDDSIYKQEPIQLSGGRWGTKLKLSHLSSYENIYMINLFRWVWMGPSLRHFVSQLLNPCLPIS